MKHSRWTNCFPIMRLTRFLRSASGKEVNGGHCVRHQTVKRLLPVFTCFLALLLPLTARAQVLTSQYDNARTGSDLHETILTPQNVNLRQFGKLFTLHVDGAVYAQPLYIPGLDIPGKGKHSVVFVATEHDSIYAFDADGHPAEPLWRVSLLNPKVDARPVAVRDVQCPFIYPEVGITSTPVIDYSSGTLYVLARTVESSGLLTHRFVQRLHALAVTTGVEKFGGPVEIQASSNGRGVGSSSGLVPFDPLRENPRAALLLAGGTVYLTWASSCDVGSYHGWMMAYDSHSLKQLAAFDATPDASDGGFWAGDTGPAADNEGNVYAATGNGRFDAARGGRNYGDTILKMKLNRDGLQIRDYFTPYNQAELDADDNDLGSGGPVLFPGPSDAHSSLVAIAGKGATLYVIDRNNMGGFHAGNNGQAVWTVPLGGDLLGAPAYWNGHLFVAAEDDFLKEFLVNRAELKLVARSREKFDDRAGIPTVSSNGPRNGILWLLTSKHWNEPDRRPAVLYAYDASNVGHELYNSEQDSGRDRAGIALRFNIPVVANGRVYIGAKGEVDVYGLISLRGVRSK
jgi:PQQ-like domain